MNIFCPEKTVLILESEDDIFIKSYLSNDSDSIYTIDKNSSEISKIGLKFDLRVVVTEIKFEDQVKIVHRYLQTGIYILKCFVYEMNEYLSTTINISQICNFFHTTFQK